MGQRFTPACSFELSIVFSFLLQEVHKTGYTIKRLNFDLWRDIWQHLMRSSVGSVLLKPLAIFLAEQGKNGSLQLIKETFFFGHLSCPRSNSSNSYGELAKHAIFIGGVFATEGGD